MLHEHKAITQLQITATFIATSWSAFRRFNQTHWVCLVTSDTRHPNVFALEHLCQMSRYSFGKFQTLRQHMMRSRNTINKHLNLFVSEDHATKCHQNFRRTSRRMPPNTSKYLAISTEITKIFENSHIMKVNKKLLP